MSLVSLIILRVNNDNLGFVSLKLFLINTLRETPGPVDPAKCHK